MRVVACILLLAAFARATDLSTIDRTIKVAPAYTSEVQLYALLVLGREAKTRIWFVLDGDRLFVDLNGNGDLTEDGECIEARSSKANPQPLILHRRSWDVPDLGAGRYTEIEVSSGIVDPAWRPSPTASNRRHMETFMAAVAKTPHANISNIYIKIDGKLRQFCNAMFATSARTAPVFHMDAPLTVGILETITPFAFERGEAPEDLTVAVGTPGFGGAQAGCFSYVRYDSFPEEARPVAHVEFPAREPGKYLPARPYELPGKC